MSAAGAAFRRAVESGDIDAGIALLADDVVFRSPAVFKPYTGRETVATILRTVVTVLEDFRYTDEFAGEGGHVLVFRGRVGDRELEGVDILGPVPAPVAPGVATTSEGLLRAIVRFDYGAGAEVARRLRAGIVAVASARRRPPKGGAFRPAPTLRVRFDDPEIF
jgi:hypothetical protein